MFLKKQTIKKNGKCYNYYRIVSSYRDEQGNRKHRMVKYLGALSDEEASKIRTDLRKRPKAKKPDAVSYEASRFGRLHPSLTFVPQDIQTLAYSPQTPKEWNVTDTDMLLLVREGCGELHLDGKKHLLKAGMAFVCQAGSGMHVLNPYTQTLLIDRITFESLAMTGLSTEDGTYGRTASQSSLHGGIDLADPRRALQLAKDLHDAASSDDGHDPIRVQLIFYQLLASIFNRQPDSVEKNAGHLIETAVRHIREHYHENLTRDRLATIVGVSPEHFSRMFKKETGRSYIDYVCHVRIRKSQELLQLSRAGLAEIAKQTGFRSEYYFSRKFKQIVGEAPSFYKKKPKTYASLLSYATSCLMHLGIVPRYGVIEPWMLDYYRGRLDLSSFEPLEEISDSVLLMLKVAGPDLTLSGSSSDVVERLHEVGPVYPVQDVYEHWHVLFFKMAEAVGRRKEAEAWLEGFDLKVAAARMKLASLLHRNETVAIFKIVSDKLYVYGSSTSMGGYVIYEALKLPPPPAVQRQLIDKKLPNKIISQQELADYSADHIFLFDYRSNWFPDKPGWMHSRAWNNLEAVRNNRVYKLDSNIFYGYDCLSLELQLEETTLQLSSHLT